MPTIEKNLSLWSEYDWSRRGEEWSAAWGGSEAQWRWSLLPRIRNFIPAGSILEIGTGWGRWTDYRKIEGDHLMGVGLSENCIEYCKQRFAEQTDVSFHLSDGKTLIDCLSTFPPCGSKWARTNVVVKNPHFMDEAQHIRTSSLVHGSSGTAKKPVILRADTANSMDSGQ